ncbi:hypothetical protein M5D96_006140, partial [Drosophila gunungcola]
LFFWVSTLVFQNYICYLLTLHIKNLLILFAHCFYIGYINFSLFFIAFHALFALFSFWPQGFFFSSATNYFPNIHTHSLASLLFRFLLYSVLLPQPHIHNRTYVHTLVDNKNKRRLKQQQ